MNNYIKMCEKAEEIQKWYKSNVKNVREGDRYICKCETCKENMFINIVKDSDIDYINNRDMTDVDPTYKEMVALSGVGEFGAFWDDGGFIYLPTQEQLQEIMLPTLGDDFIGCAPLILNKRLEESLSSKGIYNWGTSYQELWLAFVMKEKYNKIWNGEKWVKSQ